MPPPQNHKDEAAAGGARRDDFFRLLRAFAALDPDGAGRVDATRLKALITAPPEAGGGAEPLSEAEADAMVAAALAAAGGGGGGGAAAGGGGSGGGQQSLQQQFIDYEAFARELAAPARPLLGVASAAATHARRGS